eukprot:SAG11_NODE_5297_length_1603_cov_5.816099_3_plen_46_part_01
MTTTAASQELGLLHRAEVLRAAGLMAVAQLTDPEALRALPELQPNE